MNKKIIRKVFPIPFLAYFYYRLISTFIMKLQLHKVF